MILVECEESSCKNKALMKFMMMTTSQYKPHIWATRRSLGKWSSYKESSNQWCNTHIRWHVFHEGDLFGHKLSDAIKDKHGGKLAPNWDDYRVLDSLQNLMANYCQEHGMSHILKLLQLGSNDNPCVSYFH